MIAFWQTTSTRSPLNHVECQEHRTENALLPRFVSALLTICWPGLTPFSVRMWPSWSSVCHPSSVPADNSLQGWLQLLDSQSGGHIETCRKLWTPVPAKPSNLMDTLIGKEKIWRPEPHFFDSNISILIEIEKYIMCQRVLTCTILHPSHPGTRALCPASFSRSCRKRSCQAVSWWLKISNTHSSIAKWCVIWLVITCNNYLEMISDNHLINSHY